MSPFFQDRATGKNGSFREARLSPALHPISARAGLIFLRSVTYCLLLLGWSLFFVAQAGVQWHHLGLRLILTMASSFAHPSLYLPRCAAALAWPPPLSLPTNFAGAIQWAIRPACHMLTAANPLQLPSACAMLLAYAPESKMQPWRVRQQGLLQPAHVPLWKPNSPLFSAHHER